MNKNKKEITKTILKGILLSGGIAIAATSPQFGVKILPLILKYAKYKRKQKKANKKSFYNAFYRLKKEGLINMEYRGAQLFISLSKEGRKKTGKYQIDDLKIKKPKKWDKLWRVLIFDIKDKQKIKREALRGKIKQLDLYQLQKSVWVYPYEFQKEISLLRSFFGLNKDEMKIITASKIEDDKKLRNYFNIK